MRKGGKGGLLHGPGVLGVHDGGYFKHRAWQDGGVGEISHDAATCVSLNHKVGRGMCVVEFGGETQLGKRMEKKSFV